MRAYLRLDPGYFHRKMVEDGYPPAMAMAMVAAMCLAEAQPHRGRFASERLLRLLIDEPKDGVRTGLGRWVGKLIEAGDLVRLPDGTVYLDGWDEWQEGDVTVRERMSRVRSRKAKDTPPTVTPTVTDDTVETVTTPSSGKRYAVSGRHLAEDGGIFDAYYRLTARPPSSGAIAWLNRLTDEYDEPLVTAVLASEWKADPDPSTVLGRVQTKLADHERRAAKAAEERKKRGAIDEQRDLAQRLEAMTPEERQRAEARAAEVRASVAGLVKGVAQ